jgi:hypothetical protein
MIQEVAQRIRETLEAFHVWKEGQRFSDCRLVQYCGPERIGAIDVEVGETEPEIEGLVAEGFSVTWAVHRDRLYLKVWEYGYDEPGWEEVYAERDMPKPWKRMNGSF